MRMTVVVNEKHIVGVVVVEYYYYDCCIERHDYGVVAVDVDVDVVDDRSSHCSAGGEEEGEEHGAVWKLCEFHH